MTMSDCRSARPSRPSAPASRSAASKLLEPVRYELYRLGGSHAQRDVFMQLLIAAAKQAGRDRELRALVAERAALKPGAVAAWMN